MHVINALTLLEEDMLFQMLIYMGTCLKYFICCTICPQSIINLLGPIFAIKLTDFLKYFLILSITISCLSIFLWMVRRGYPKINSTSF